ncbi:MAG: chemotaxis protein CheW [Gemmatimonadaceae bacterium]
MTAPDAETVATRTRGGKYLTFVLANEEYAFEIHTVHEIVGIMAITPVPHSHPVIRGVVNLRGKVVPIVDLRRRFAMTPPAAGVAPATCIIVLHVRNLLVGIAVDAVSDVRMIHDAEIEPPPAFGSDVDTSCLLGVANSEGKVRMLLDAEKVVALDVIASL